MCLFTPMILVIRAEIALFIVLHLVIMIRRRLLTMDECSSYMKKSCSSIFEIVASFENILKVTHVPSILLITLQVATKANTLLLILNSNLINDFHYLEAPY